MHACERQEGTRQLTMIVVCFSPPSTRYEREMIEEKGAHTRAEHSSETIEIFMRFAIVKWRERIALTSQPAFEVIFQTHAGLNAIDLLSYCNQEGRRSGRENRQNAHSTERSIFRVMNSQQHSEFAQYSEYISRIHTIPSKFNRPSIIIIQAINKLSRESNSSRKASEQLTYHFSNTKLVSALGLLLAKKKSY